MTRLTDYTIIPGERRQFLLLFLPEVPDIKIEKCARKGGDFCEAQQSGKALVGLLAIVLVIGCAVGGTVAWLVSKPAAITNTFTVGDINATLGETDNTYHIVPGVNISKDPVATVKAKSEDCYLFVQVTEENWPEFRETVDGKEVRKVKLRDRPLNVWTPLEGHEGCVLLCG